jgi:hypothetical protein
MTATACTASIALITPTTGGAAMQLLTIPTPTTPVDDACMSQGGLVDRQTAAADCVVLWTDSRPSSAPTMLRPAAAAACPVCAVDHAAQ